MSAEEWREFVAGQLDRWYGPAAAERGTAAPAAVLVAGADPEEYAHERALTPPGGKVPPPVGGPVWRALGSLRRQLSGKAARPPAPAPPGLPPPVPPSPSRPAEPLPAAAAPEPAAVDYEPEAEIAPGVFYARKKPRFPRP